MSGSKEEDGGGEEGGNQHGGADGHDAGSHTQVETEGWELYNPTKQLHTHCNGLEVAISSTPRMCRRGVLHISVNPSLRSSSHRTVTYMKPPPSHSANCLIHAVSMAGANPTHFDPRGCPHKPGKQTTIHLEKHTHGDGHGDRNDVMTKRN